MKSFRLLSQIKIFIDLYGVKWDNFPPETGDEQLDNMF